MTVYIILIAFILFGQLLFKKKAIKKKTYCIFICICMILISGLRAKTVGMWDTPTIYLPSFKIINKNSIAQLLTMQDTQFKFIGFDIYSKFIGYISQNENFYIFMMAWPFFVAITYLINKYSDIPMYSFLAILAFGYLTYSFSMIRGMIAYAALVMALDALIERKWKKYLIWILIASLFHITSLLFLLVFFIEKIRWTAKRIIILFAACLFAQGIFPMIWSWFVQRFISRWLTTYNYYADKGGILADALLFVYISTVLLAVAKIILSKKKVLVSGTSAKMASNKRKMKEKNILTDNLFYNFLMGMAVLASILIFLTSVLSEMIRIAMILGIGCILLAGKRTSSTSKDNKLFIVLGEMTLAALYIVYFLFAALPNMNSVPYMFFWQ